MKKISYVLVSRNDSYCGDAVGRLVNTLNHTGTILSDHNASDQSEVILVDWSSPNEPLKDVIGNRVNDAIKSILKIITVEPSIAAKYQKDSPFSEVHAMNCGFRRIKGRYFARIDQDTLIGHRFVEWFYNEFEVSDYGFNWPKVLFSSRRNLDSIQTATHAFVDIIKDPLYSRQIEICHDHNHYARLLPHKVFFPFYGGAVGIMIVEKELYLKHKGFNEEMIYMNNMDTEFLNRLAVDNLLYNLGLKVDADFYHQYHDRSDGASNDTTQPHALHEGSRETNSLDYRNKLMDNPNPSTWGLVKENLEITILSLQNN